MAHFSRRTENTGESDLATVRLIARRTGAGAGGLATGRLSARIPGSGTTLPVPGRELAPEKAEPAAPANGGQHYAGGARLYLSTESCGALGISGGKRAICWYDVQR